MKKFNDFINENIKNYDDCESLANLLIQNYSIEDIPTECHYNLVDKLCELYDDGLIKTKDDMKKYIDNYIESDIINSFYEIEDNELTDYMKRRMGDYSDDENFENTGETDYMKRRKEE